MHPDVLISTWSSLPDRASVYDRLSSPSPTIAVTDETNTSYMR